MNKRKCRVCGSFLPSTPFYVLHRQIGILEVYLCPNCGARNDEWVPKILQG